MMYHATDIWTSYGSIGLIGEHVVKLDATNNDLGALLHLAAHNLKPPDTPLLVEHCGVVGEQNEDGWTPQHEASARADVILLLLDHTTNGREDSRHATSLYSTRTRTALAYAWYG